MRCLFRTNTWCSTWLVCLHSPLSGMFSASRRRSESTPSSPSPLRSPCGSPVTGQWHHGEQQTETTRQPQTVRLLPLPHTSRLPPSGQSQYDYTHSLRCRRMWHSHAVSDLNGLSEAALPQHFSMDEVRRAEDAVRPVGHDAERLRSIDVLPLGDGGGCIAGAWWFVNAVASPGGWREEGEEKEIKWWRGNERGKVEKGRVLLLLQQELRAGIVSVKKRISSCSCFFKLSI